MFDWENAIALHAKQRNRTSSLVEGEVSWFLSSYGGNLGYILELQRRYPFETGVVQRSQDTCLGTTDTSGM